MRPKIDHKMFEALGELLEPPPPPAVITPPRPWFPRQTPAQKKLFYSTKKSILCHGPKGGSKCRTGDALIYTDDGLVRLEELRPQGAKAGEFSPINQPVLAFDGAKVVQATAKQFWVEDGKRAMKCELANGSELTGSPRHPLWVCAQPPSGDHTFAYFSLSEMEAKKKGGWRFWTPFVGHTQWTKPGYVSVAVEKRLTICKMCGKKASARGLCDSHYRNQVIYHQREHPLTEEVKIQITENLSYAIGALVGDGHLRCSTGDNRSVGFTNMDNECVAGVERGLEEIGCNLKRVKQLSFQFLVLPAQNIKPIIRKLGLDHLSYSKRIPGEIMSSPKSVAAAFLRGLFDTDGCVDLMGRVSMVTVSEHLGRDVQDLLAAFGILSVRRRRKTSSGRPTWNISMRGQHAERFMRDIGFEITRKAARLKTGKISKRCPNGYNHNSYGYPNPIRKVCRQAWDEATFAKTRKVSQEHKRLCSWGSVPGSHKLKEIIEIFGSAHLFTPFLVSDNWLEVGSITETEAELFDLSVPGPTSFLASGTINHNSFGVGDLLVKHCYENRNAFALILVKVQNMAIKGGAWDKLINEVLPRWRDGNRDPQGNKLDDGIGLHYTDVKFDANHCPYIWIFNQHGGWSMVSVMSCPHAGQLRSRIRGVEPSIVFVDELTSCESAEYYESVAAQLGRRPMVQGPQQYIGACNPEGPSHWVYKKWFVEPYNDETGEKDENFEDIPFPCEDNRENLQPGYLEGLVSIYGRNATEAARMIGGEWVDQPSGEGLFRELFNPLIHVRPLDERFQPHQAEWLLPHPDHAFIIGMDPGSVFNAFIFMQWMPVDGRLKWVIFDEIVTIRKPIKYPDLIPMVMRRIRWWRDLIGKETPMVWISDNTAFNQYRAAQGSYDALEMEKVYEAHRLKYNLEPLRIKQAPKFQGSVEARIRIEQTALAQEEIIVSSRCTRVIAMYLRLESEKQKNGQPFDPKLAMTTSRKGDHIHTFDAGSYPKLTASISPSMLQPTREGTQRLISVAA